MNLTALANTTELIRLALLEDLPEGDLTSDNLFRDQAYSQATLSTRQPAVISGITVAEQVFFMVDPQIETTALVEDGDTVASDTPILRVSGPTRSILKAERVALNFLQHLSGIATLTYQYMGTISPTKAQITHTRKTVPGMRHLAIQAVLHGGGVLNRNSLSDAVLIKDNHIQAAGGLTPAIEAIRESTAAGTPISVECDTLDQVSEALRAGANRLLLDNMKPNQLRDAVKQAKGKALTEASGGITLKNALEIAQTGVDFISTSQLTLSSYAADIGLDFEN